MSNTSKIISSLYSGKLSEANEAFTASMKDRVNVVLDEKKIAVASQIYNEDESFLYNKNLDEAWDSRAHPVLPIGRVNLDTHKNQLFGNVFHGWEANKGSNILLKHRESRDYPERTGVMRVVHTSEPHDSAATRYPKTSTMNIKHDQTGAAIGGDWEVHSVHPHSEAGLQSLKAASGKKSLSFSTFK